MNPTEGATMIATDPNTRAGRMLAAGRITVTFRSPSGTHITLLAKARANVDGQWKGVPLAEAMVVSIEVPNEGAWNDRVAKVTRRNGLREEQGADPARVWCAKQLLLYVAGQPTAAGLEIFEEERCGVCGRALTDPVSIGRGIGPECYGRMTGSQHQVKGVGIEGAATMDEVDLTSAERADLLLPADESQLQRWEDEAADEMAAENAAVIAAERCAENAAQLDRDGAMCDGEAIPSDLAEQWATLGEALAASGDGRDGKGVPYGYGDHRQRRAALQQRIEDEDGTKGRVVYPAYCQQMGADLPGGELPGTTWEDIFRPVAEAKGILLP